MALLGRRSDYHMRPTNKEPEWSSLCNNVFDQYLDCDDPFDFQPESRERSSSDDSVNLFDFSGSSGQSNHSNHTSDTSPIPSWEVLGLDHTIPVAKQPQAKAPVDFWTKKLHALERNAAESERRQQRLRSTKSHPDFLSLGGYPSPPARPQSPTDQSSFAQSHRSHLTANGRKTPAQRCVTLRSVSRGRPAGVSKPLAAGAVNPYATVRKSNASPPKMMTPSRYRAGFKDVWAERIEASPKKYELRVPSHPFPESPPPSSRAFQDDFAAFGSPAAYPAHLAYDGQLSPLANTFQQTQIYTPSVSPLLSPNEGTAPSYFDIPPLPANLYSTGDTHIVPLNDTAPLYPERTSSLAASKIQTFDFGFSESPDIDQWSGAPFTEPGFANFTTRNASYNDPFAIGRSVLLSSEDLDVGLGISCDPNLVSGYAVGPDTALLPPTTYRPHLANGEYIPHGLPHTPHRVPKAYFRSESPSPALTEPRARQSSKSRRTSKHRRAKSTNGTPRHSQNMEQGGFVNFTPQDHGRILNGVAPSGSSKTKARREKEAADKRRRISQAAVRAIMEAGGDPNTLTRAGLVE